MTRAAAAGPVLALVVSVGAVAAPVYPTGAARGPGPARTVASAPGDVGGYHRPVPGEVLRGFDPPSTPYGPGHLGVDLAAEPGEPVRAAGAGVVAFAGVVAGRPVVVLAHPDGVRTEYEPVRPAFGRGARVVAGDLIGSLAGRHRGCSRPCLHWGARFGDHYLDPLSLLDRLGPVRLLPWPRGPDR